MRILVVMAILLLPFQALAHANEEYLDTIDTVRTSIVLVESERESTSSMTPGSPLDRYLKKKLPQQNPSAIGTGFVVDDQYIITNNHVVQDGLRIMVSFENEPERYVAEVIGVDPLSDIAVLRAKDMPKKPELAWGNSDDLRPGQQVWAIGHPRGLFYTVSKGVVSHKKRRLSNGWQTAIQSDVAINKGNSGGPLMTMDGSVVAINTLILSSDGDNSGLSFSVDSHVARFVIERLIADGRIDRPKMGTGLKYDPELYRVSITTIEGGSAADKAGIEPNDVILQADGRKIVTMDDLFDALQYKAPYEDMKLVILRGNDIIEITLTLGMLDAAEVEEQQNELKPD